MTDLADRLRAIRVFGGDLLSFDTDHLPDDPRVLYVNWLIDAAESGVAEPHVAILSTVDAAGHPDARALILKDVDDEGWWFASSSSGPKGEQLSANPWAAMTWYWPGRGRQVRLRGEVRRGGPEVSAADFLARAPGGRAEALVGHQSHDLSSREELDAALATAYARITADPELVAEDWTRYVLRANEVQFFQGDLTRKHTRVRYQRTDDIWSHHLLWP